MNKREMIMAKQKNDINLAGRVAVITGGAQGIGLAVARRFIDSGASVALWDVDTDELERARSALSADGRVRAVACDQSKWEDVKAAAEQTSSAFQRIDILVNNAGVAGSSAKLTDYALEEWRRVIEIDLNGVFYCCRAIVPRMVAQNYGRIVNVSSVAGKEGNPLAGAYSAAKAGVLALTKSLGKELAGYDISVNAVTPSPVKTRILNELSQEHIDYMLARVPRGRFVETDEAASMIAFMASEENSFTTGATFDLSGGRTTY